MTEMMGPNDDGDEEETPETLAEICLSVDGTAEEVQARIAAGEDVNAPRPDGYTPLHHAAMADWDARDDRRMVLLIRAGARLEARLPVGTPHDRGGFTPLMLAAREGRAGQVEALIQAGADVAAQDGRGRTPLMLAAGQAFEVEIKVGALLAAGADPAQVSADGMTSLDYARECLAIQASIGEEAVGSDEAAIHESVRATMREAGVPEHLLPPPPRGEVWRYTRGRVLELRRVVGLLEDRSRRAP